ANQLARQLRCKHTAQNQVVAILIERSQEFIISMLAILKAGGTYLPIDLQSPVEWINYMLEDSNAAVLLTQSTVIEGMELAYSGDILLLSDSDPSNGEETEPKDIGCCNNLAYIMYTSGSTGRPKGVLIEHKSVIRLVINPNYIQFQTGDRILQTGNPAFDAVTFEIWGALLNGLSLHVVDDAELLDPFKLAERIRDQHITVVWLTASLFNQFSTYNERMFAPLRVLLIGGEALSPEHVNKIRRKYPDLIMVNGYGPTENTTFSLCHSINCEYETSIPIGRPINGTRAYILDQGMNLSPIGVPGELCVAGDGLAREYLNLDEETARNFVTDPYMP
ncbi:AMP-binding protein, partial [Paenibacillus dendritiformis]|uniref:AMP-binding protein n=1 Tax=Paenibacillus dendritiformis TaxID=130049 RepID=UPI00387E1BBB